MASTLATKPCWPTPASWQQTKACSQSPTPSIPTQPNFCSQAAPQGCLSLCVSALAALKPWARCCGRRALQPRSGRLSAYAFAEQALAHALQARHVCVGANFTFGHRQEGDVQALKAFGQELGFAVHPVGLVGRQGAEQHVSSTAIRQLIERGDIEQAGLWLGHPVRVLGQVIRGAQRGTAFGFPTANIAADNPCLPARGVYAAWAYPHTAQAPYRAVVNVGHHPTVGAADAVQVEVHLLDYNGASLYGTELAIDLMARLRDEQRFVDVEALKAQIGRDVARGRELLK